MTQAIDHSSSLAAAPRSYARRVLGDTFVRSGARLGAAWIGTLAFAALFAPLLANSHPLIMQTADGRWSSPLVRHLTSADVTLLVTFATAVATLCVRGASVGHRCAITAIIGVVCAFLTVWPNAPRLLEAYRRDALAEALAPWCAAPRVFVLTGAVAVLGLGALVWLLGRVQPRRWVSGVVIGWYVVVVGVLLVVPIKPPGAIVYSQYREGIAAGDIVFHVFAPIPHSPMDYQRDAHGPRLNAPSGRHLLGTELNGADLLSRMIHASRIALAIGLIATGIALVIGVILGSLMGYLVGVTDILGMRLVEIVEAIPTLFLLIIFVSFFGRNLYLMMVIIGVTSWTGYCRYIRAEFLRLRQQEFIQAARACGLPIWSILFRHMLPNGVAPVLVSASFGVASAILAETTLSFLGLGLVDEPSWGEMLNQSLGIGGAFHWWLATFPGLAIFLTVFSYNLVGEAMRDAIDPHTKRAAAM